MNRNGCFPLLFVRLEQLYTETLEVISELLEKDLGEEAKREEKEKKTGVPHHLCATVKSHIFTCFYKNGHGYIKAGHLFLSLLPVLPSPLGRPVMKP